MLQLCLLRIAGNIIHESITSENHSYLHAGLILDHLSRVLAWDVVVARCRYHTHLVVMHRVQKPEEYCLTVRNKIDKLPVVATAPKTIITTNKI